MRSLFLIFIILVLPSAIQASEGLGLSISPQIFELEVFPGETISQKVKIGNLSHLSLPISIRVVDFTTKEDTGEMSFDKMAQELSIASWKWFEIESPDLILEPGEKRDVSFSISIPEDAEPYGRYSLMIFEPRFPSFYFEEYKMIAGQEERITSPRTIPVVGVPFLVSIKTLALESEEKEKLEVVKFSLPEEDRILALESIVSRIAAGVILAADFNITEKAPSGFVLKIKNKDIYHIRPYGKISIYNIFGSKIGEAEVLQNTILPGKTRLFPVEFFPEIPEYLKWLPSSVSDFIFQNFFIGKYRAELELEAKTPVRAEVFKPSSLFILNFFSFPWHFWLPFILVFSTFIFLIAKYEKRIVLAFKVLISK